jgi:brefeldin A-inhibited guanine nucleotide-exchange protein
MVEKFAEKFCTDNPGIFDCADAAYVLAFALIMLHTDSYNPTVKKKMSFDDFQRINRGINNGGDLDPQMLQDCYDNIKGEEMTLQDDFRARIRIENPANVKQKTELLVKENEQML